MNPHFCIHVSVVTVCLPETNSRQFTDFKTCELCQSVNLSPCVQGNCSQVKRVHKREHMNVSFIAVINQHINQHILINYISTLESVICVIVNLCTRFSCFSTISSFCLNRLRSKLIGMSFGIV